MSKSYRIRTTPGEDNGYLKVNLDLSQNYDHLEILRKKRMEREKIEKKRSDMLLAKVDIYGIIIIIIVIIIYKF